jgi:hypothetical protein
MRIAALSTIVLTAACGEAPLAVEAGEYEVSLSGGQTSCPANEPVFDPDYELWFCVVGSFVEGVTYVESLEDVPYLDCPDLLVAPPRPWYVDGEGEEWWIEDGSTGDQFEAYAEDGVLAAYGWVPFYTAYGGDEASVDTTLYAAEARVLEGSIVLEVPSVYGYCTITFDAIAVRVD